MPEPKISVVIPYRDRLDNLRIALRALADQTLGRDGFEVVLGVMELSEEYLAVCREFADTLDIVSVLSARPWQVGYARNLAIRQATGEVLVLMDVDMALPPDCLAELYQRHFGYGQRACVVGQMIDYDNNTGDVTEVDVLPYEYYRKLLAEVAADRSVWVDPRLEARHVIPWSFAWTALIALPRDLVVGHDLLFDPAFHGYGVEDLEWAYRVCRTGTPITVAKDFSGVHLPHVRSVAANKRTEGPNYRYFLGKWPGVDVELACALGDFAANEAYPDLLDELHRATGTPGAALAVVRGTVDGHSHLVVGVTVDGAGRLPRGVPLDPTTVAGALPAGGNVEQALPIVGLALPYADASIDHCRVLPPVLRLAPRYRDLVLAEAARVTRTQVSTVEG